MPSFVRSGAALAVNSQTASSQARSSITGLADGGFVIAWQTDNTAQDGAGSAIKLQRYDAQGVAVGGEALVNNVAAGDQSGARVTSLASGGYVVTWETADVAQDGYGTAIKARLFDAAGAAVGGEFRVNSQTFMDQKQPATVGLADGSFVVAWYTTDTSADGSGWAVKAQRFSAAGVAMGAEFRVNSVAFGSQNNIDIASLANGGFVVTWQTGNSLGTQVYAQAYGADGAATGTQILVTDDFGSRTHGRVAGLPNGGFVVTWMTEDESGLGIYAQLFDASRNKVGAQIAVNTLTSMSQYDPDIAALADGTFMITWQTQAGGIKGQAFTATGQRIGGEFLVADAGDASETEGAIAALPDGKFVVGWTHNVTGSASGSDIRLQMLAPNRAPELGEATRVLSIQENNTIVGMIAATDADGPSPLSYTIAGGADAARFSIYPTTGYLTFVSSPNFEAPGDADGDNVYEVIVRASDGELHDLQTVLVTITNRNEAPVITSNGGGASASVSVGEDAYVATHVTATDVEGDAITYSISGGADASRFLIDSSTGELIFLMSPDFENPADADGNNVYQVTVRASDGQWTDTQSLSIAVADSNDRPRIVSNGGGSSSSLDIDEGQTAVTTVVAIDDGRPGPVTYSITGGSSADLFVIDAVTGELSFIEAADYEAPFGGYNFYTVYVTAGDGELSTFQMVQIGVNNVNEGVTITSGSAASLEENNSAVTVVSAVDEDGDAVAFSISGGADAGLFEIDAATGALSFIAAPDFDAPTDANGDNVYDVEVSATDGALSDSKSLAVTILDRNEGIFITSNGGDNSAALTIDEGTSHVTTVIAHDPDGATPIYTITGGADVSRFTIDSATGVLSFVEAPDYEAPLDAHGDNIYEVIVTASDGELSSSQFLSVLIRNVNEAVTIISGGGADSVAVTVDENQAVVASVSAVDTDGAPVLYSIAGGADAALFGIDPVSGELRFAQGADYDAPGDADGDNVYEVIVAADDGWLSDTQAFSVTVADVDEPLAITSYAGDFYVSLAIGENSRDVGVVSAEDPEGAAVVYSIVDSYDGVSFTIDAQTGVLQFVTAPNHESPADLDGDNVYTVLVAATDGNFFDYQTVSIQVGDVEEGVAITTGPALSVDEDSAFVAKVTATDGDGDPIGYSIVGGADASHFVINPETGDLTIRASLDFEAPADADGDNVYEVTVRASDGQFSDERQMSITVNDVFDDIEIVSYGGADSVSLTMQESSSFQVADVDASFSPFWGVRFAIAGGADASLFTVDPYDGELSFNYPFMPNFEAPGDADGDNVYDVVVVATMGTSTDTQAFAITVADRNEGLWITSNGSGDANLSMNEGDSNVTTVTAYDMDGDVPAYSIVGGADAALFAIDAATGALTFIAAPDYEAPHNGSGTNFYTVEVGASDGEFTDTQRIRIQIGNVNERPAITSGGGGETIAVTVNENGLAVTSITASDPDDNPLTYSIVGGADASRFTIEAWSGALRFVQGPNFEAPGDVGGNNVYDVVVSVTDGLLTDSQAVAVTVANLAEIVTITSNGGGASASVAVAENGTAVATVTASNPDGGGAVTYAIAGGADAARFTINASTGVLAFVAAPNFEAPADAGANNVYDVAVSAANEATVDTQALAVTVGNVNEQMTITSNGGGTSAAVSVNENVSVVTTVVGVDPDGGPVTYVILHGGDSGRFTIDSTTGVLSFRAAPNFEAPGDADGNNVYDVVVMASDGHWSDTQTIAVTVGNVNEAPVITSSGGGASGSVSVAENSVAVAVVAASDPDGGAVTYSIVGGADSSRLTIDSSTGALAFVSAPNFEAPADAGGNNVYDVVVSATDGSSTDTQALAVSVGNVNEAVVITSNGGGSSAAVAAAENGTAVTIVSASDADGGPVTYAIAGGADASRFTINATTGALAFVAAPNFEAPTDAGANNVYDLIVSASDGTFTDTQALAVSVGNVNEAVAITSGGGGSSAAVSVAENGSAVTTVAASDADGGAVTYAIAGGADAARFTINAATGALAFVTAPNFEAPADAGANNVYDVTVSASDGSFTDTQALAVTVTNVLEGNVINGTASADNISTASSPAGQPRATQLEDTIYGMGGSDTISGAGGEDIIDGGAANDTITGGLGADLLIGGLGADRFSYGSTAESTASAADTIQDFSRTQGDKINLNAIDANANNGGNQNFAFIGTAAFSGVAGQLRFEQIAGNTFVSADVNGDRIGDLQIQLTGLVSLISTDFVL